LKVLATGGVYVSGGIPPRILPALSTGTFMEAFRRKGRMADLLGRVPVQVVLNTKIGLFGAAAHGLDQRDTHRARRPRGAAAAGKREQEARR